MHRRRTRPVDLLLAVLTVMLATLVAPSVVPAGAADEPPGSTRPDNLPEGATVVPSSVNLYVYPVAIEGPEPRIGCVELLTQEFDFSGYYDPDEDAWGQTYGWYPDPYNDGEYIRDIKVPRQLYFNSTTPPEGLGSSADPVRTYDRWGFVYQVPGAGGAQENRVVWHSFGSKRAIIYYEAFVLLPADDAEDCYFGPGVHPYERLREQAERSVLWTTKFITNARPIASFDWEVTDPANSEVTFTNRSFDAEDGDPHNSRWDFGDGRTSVARNPVHRFPGPGSYEVTLTVGDSVGHTASITRTVVVDGPLVVNSVGDAPAVNPGVDCDTGGTVGVAKECTLRAAIQVANTRGNQEIRFGITTAGVPTIRPTSPLPATTGEVTIDGTTQPGSGMVQIDGGGEAGLVIGGGTATVRGVAIRGTTGAGIVVTGGSDHAITGDVFGADATGTTASGGNAWGVLVTGGSGVSVRDNVFGGSGVLVGTDASGTTVTDNRIGVRADGSTLLGSPEVGVAVFGAGTTVSSNTIRATAAATVVAGSAATEVTVRDNHLGTNSAGTAAFDDTGYAVRIDGAPGVSVTRNNAVAATGPAAVAVAGRVELEQEPNGSVSMLPPTAGPSDGPVSGIGVTVEANTIGLVGETAATPSAENGIVTWSGAADVTVSENVVVGTGASALSLEDSDGVTVTGNRIGRTSGGTSLPVRGGVRVSHSTGVVLGTAAAPNRIDATHRGITVNESDGISMAGNIVDGANTGIEVYAEAASITGNTVTGAQGTGIRMDGNRSVASGNVVTGSGDGIVASGEAVLVEVNRIGVAAGGDTVIGNTGSGVGVPSGRVEVTRNVIAGSGGLGMDVANGAVATLRGNRLWANAGGAIRSPGGPAAPEIVAAMRSADGSRTTLMISGLPTTGAGRLELFANSGSCLDAQASIVMDITREHDGVSPNRFVVLRNTSRDHFTVTYTNAQGNTSELSNCESVAPQADGDGDGSVDVIDRLLGFEDDPTRALAVTDDEQLMLVATLPVDPDTGVGGGDLVGVTVGDDPASDGHPAGWSLPHGAISFRVSGLESGGATRVSMTVLSGSGRISGDSYWKYGPQSPGDSPGWYRFDHDEVSGTGASRVTSLPVADLGYRESFVLDLRDGARGDSDGFANGVITDPGGPVFEESPETPTTTVPPTTAPDPTVPATAQPRSGDPGSGTTTAPSWTSQGTLPRTGSDPGRLALLAVVLIVGGFALAYSVKRSRRGRSTGT